MSQRETPALSVILPTSDDFSSIRHTVRALSRQSVCDRLELVIVAPREGIYVPEDAVSMFARTQIVNGGPIKTSNISRSAGIRAASAPFVALSEDHSFPDPQWAEAIINAHADGYAAVAPIVQNANPKSTVSWANLLLEYGLWIDRSTRAEMDNLPGHNSSYDRALLMSYGDNLENMLEVEAVLQRDMADRGHRLLLEPRATTQHFNFSKIRSTLPLRFNCGRSFAGHRIIGWSMPKRIAFALGAPLIPLVRLVRILKMLRSSERYSSLIPRIIPMLCLAVLTDGLGELVGYITGPGDSPRYLGLIEFKRWNVMNASDQKDFWKMVGESA
jgi:hypothetical protein